MEKINNSNIQYDENIFYLKHMLNSIEVGINTNTNKELFQKKIKDDLLFIYKCKNILLDKLLKNDRLITRNILLQNICTLIDKYNSVKKNSIEKGIVKSESFNEIDSKNKKDCETIEDILLKAGESYYKEDLTTNKELNILLMDTDTKDEI